MHAIGHVAANLSFAAVAISLTHTVKTLEPVFSVVLSKLVLGQSTPLPVVGTLVPVMVSLLALRGDARQRHLLTLKGRTVHMLSLAMHA